MTLAAWILFGCVLAMGGAFLVQAKVSSRWEGMYRKEQKSHSETAEYLQRELQRHYELESRWVRMEGFEEWKANRNLEMRERFSVPDGTTLAHETPQETWDTIIDSAIRNTKTAPRHATPTDNAFRRLIERLNRL